MTGSLDFVISITNPSSGPLTVSEYKRWDDLGGKYTPGCFPEGNRVLQRLHQRILTMAKAPESTGYVTLEAACWIEEQNDTTSVWTQAGKIPLAQAELFEGQSVTAAHLG